MFSKSSIETANNLLQDYVLDFARLYGTSLVKSLNSYWIQSSNKFAFLCLVSIEYRGSKHLAYHCLSFGSIIETDAFGFESLNGIFMGMLHGMKELDIELVNAFNLYTIACTAHSNYDYENKDLLLLVKSQLMDKM